MKFRSLLLVSLTLFTACTAAPTATVRPDPCRDAVDRAALAREVSQQISLLDAALVICRDVDAFTDGLRLHPGVIAVAPATFIQRRCEDPPDQRVQRSSICQTVAPPSSDVPGQDAAKVYIGRTLDGRSVELRSDQVRFTDGRPSGIIEVVEVSTTQGCSGLSALYSQWIPLVKLEDRGDELSVYAQHTLNVMRSLGCEIPGDPSRPAALNGLSETETEDGQEED
jgi:hypothetical protein